MTFGIPALVLASGFAGYKLANYYTRQPGLNKTQNTIQHAFRTPVVRTMNQTIRIANPYPT
jgi:hypothetical protein